jgi:uncharacterized protein
VNRHNLVVACAAAFLGACSSAPTRYHSLTRIDQAIRPPGDPGATVCTTDSPAPVSTEPVGSILLARVAVPAEADRMQLVLHQTPTRLAVYETERWAAPLADQVSTILVGNLRTALPNTSITSDPLLTGTGAPLRLYVDIEELDALAGKEATVRARWKLSVKGDTASQTGTCSARQPLQSTNLDDLVLAWSRSLADISTRLAASIAH